MIKASSLKYHWQRVVCLVYIGSIITVCQTGMATTEPVKISTHPSYPPIMFQINKVPKGIALDVAIDILDQLKVPYELIFSGPWNRVLERARQGKIDLVAGLYYSKERATYLDYSDSIMDDHTVLFVWKGKEFPYNTLADIKGKRGTANLGASFGTAVDPFLATEVKMQRVVQSIQNYRLLELGRVDFFIFGLFAGQAQANKLGFGGKVVALPTPVVTEKIFLGFSKKSPHKHLLQKINPLIQSKITTKVIEKLYESNLQAYLQAPETTATN